MKTLRERLRDADPLGHEPPLDEAQVREMRRMVLAAADRPRHRVAGATVWRAVGLGATAALVIGVAASWGRGDEGAYVHAPADPVDAVAGGAARQLQFATPGGTRVVWVFNADFER